MVEHGFGQAWARYYDETLNPEVVANTPAETEFLAELAGSGPAVEIGIGTGRVGLELVRRGVRVIGVESSPDMVEQLRRKPDGEQIEVIVGDFLDVDLPDRAALVYCTFGTIFQLSTQERQLRCFERARGLVADGGCFVVETFVPDLTGFVYDQRVHVDRSPDDAVKLIAVERHERATQRLTTEIFVLQDRRYELLPLTLRYAYPDELDLMARHAGLTLSERWSDWHRSPFEADSRSHVSVYR